MSEFYELKRKQASTTTNTRDVDYWKSRCKASETRVQELSEALVVSSRTISMLEATLKAFDKVLKLIGSNKDKFMDSALLRKFLTTDVTVKMCPGHRPKVDVFDLSSIYDADPVDIIKNYNGVSIDVSVLDGIHIEGIASNDDDEDEDD